MLGLRSETEEEVLRAVIDATRLLVLVVDASGVVQAVNAALERATGLSGAACMRPIWELAVVADERARLRAAFAPLRAEALPGSLVFHLVSGIASRVVDWDIRVIHGEPTEAARRGAKSAETYARRLAVLIDRLLDVSRLATGSMAVTGDDLDVGQVVHQLVTAMGPDLKTAGCTMDVRTPPYVVTARWDRVRIEQVLSNLLTNAMKFGAGCAIEVVVEAGHSHVRISIRDHGIGISEQDQARIFGRFERAVSIRNFGGLGLGLYVSAQIIRAHQGSIRVESELGKGACFIIELPRYPAETAPRDEANSATPMSSS